MTDLKPFSGRILSIDVFRAITMFLMIFVNDVSGVSNIPAWIEHTAADTDGMGFSDIIFPAFLFIVGLSVPMAIQARLNKGVPFIKILFYILLRALALIVMGFFHVNLESYSSAAVLPYSVFAILITIGFFLIWNDYPDTLKKTWKYILTATGIVLLIVMAFLYKGGDAKAPHGMEPSWWGILGIIGWAYLVSALVYLLVKGNFKGMAIAALVFFLINVLTHARIINLDLPVIGDASSISLIMGGILISLFYTRNFKVVKTAGFWLKFTAAGVIAIAFGFLIRPYAGGISKIYATPAWVFICMGIGILFYQLMIWLVDEKHRTKWFNVIKPAGTSTLTCYLIPYLLYSVFDLVGFDYPPYFNEGPGGIIRSFMVAFLVIGIVNLLEWKRIRLKI